MEEDIDKHGIIVPTENSKSSKSKKSQKEKKKNQKKMRSKSWHGKSKKTDETELTGDEAISKKKTSLRGRLKNKLSLRRSSDEKSEKDSGNDTQESDQILCSSNEIDERDLNLPETACSAADHEKKAEPVTQSYIEPIEQNKTEEEVEEQQDLLVTEANVAIVGHSVPEHINDVTGSECFTPEDEGQLHPSWDSDELLKAELQQKEDNKLTACETEIATKIANYVAEITDDTDEIESCNTTVTAIAQEADENEFNADADAEQDIENEAEVEVIEAGVEVKEAAPVECGTPEEEEEFQEGESKPNEKPQNTADTKPIKRNTDNVGDNKLSKVALGGMYKNMKLSRTYCACCNVM